MRVKVRLKNPPKPMYPCYPDFIRSMEAFMQEVNMLRTAVSTVLVLDKEMNKVTRDTLTERLASLDEVLYGAPQE